MNELAENILEAHILIVDDNKANVALLQTMLKREGYKNVSALTDSREVRQAFEAARHDLILLDIRMPHFDGFEIMEQLKPLVEGDYLPVLVLTAQMDSETRARALQSGALDFVNKPFDQVEVLNRIRNMLEVRLLHNQVRDQNAALEDKVRLRTVEIENTRMEIIHRLGRAGEYRDNETGNHVIRMSRFSKNLALAAGLPETEAEVLLNAAPMHDIGKVGIPDRILLKPGKLDPQEWAIMQSHTGIGADILADGNSPLMELARVVALTHHEKWDGSGYPDGLKGEKIPIVGRITAICDVFDALTSERPYKKAWSVREALDYIVELSGTQFEPALVTAFMGIKDEILEIRESLLDTNDASNIP